MKKTYLVALTIAAAFVLGCGGGGGGGLSLSITPRSSTATTNVEFGEIGGVTLQAVLSNGEAPTNVQWSSNAPLVGVSFPVVGEPEAADVGCSLEGPSGGTVTATITATSQGLTGTATVVCNWD